MAAFRIDLPLRFGDCDPSGVAYFPSYLNLLNAAVEEFWSALGHPWTIEIGGHGRGTPTAHLSCDFIRPSRFGDRLRFEIRIARLGTTSLGLEHQIYCGDEKRWSASQVLVSVDLSTGAATPWRTDVRQALTEFMETDDAYDSAA